MAAQRGNPTRPSGGLRASPEQQRGWRWERAGDLVSAPVRCRREQWYLARARPADGWSGDRAEFLLRFHPAAGADRAQVLVLHAAGPAPGVPAAGRSGPELLGWVQAPPDATHLQLSLADPAQARQFAEIVFLPVAERDPNCHPLANVPRWGLYRSPLPLERVGLPPDLAELASDLAEQDITVLRPRSREELVARTRGLAWVLDPAWVLEFGLTWPDLERLAAGSWLLVDLQTAAGLLGQSGAVTPRLVTVRSPHGLMSARVEYADVPTRGFALQDVFPYASQDVAGGFRLRALRADRAWQRFADRRALATLLSSETPTAARSGDVLSAALPVDGGELLICDLPWLVAGRFGPLVAPRLARHALRMHLAGPLADTAQYWHPWDDTQILLRDTADLARRYPPLATARWAGADPGRAHLGIGLPALEPRRASRTLVLATGRIDRRELHAGLPPEPLIIFMKLLAREQRERTAWAREHLRDQAVIWQFDSAAGLKYAANFASAGPLLCGRVRTVRLERDGGRVRLAGGLVLLEADEGLLGDGALEYQVRLDAALRRLIEQTGA